MLELGEHFETLILSCLKNLCVSEQISKNANAYDKACLSRIEKRLDEIGNGGPPSVDLLLFWRPEMDNLELSWTDIP